MFSKNDAESVLSQLGVATTETNVEQMEVMLSAFEIYLDRQRTYKDLWAAAGSDDSARHCKHKAMRMEILDEVYLAERRDTGLDLINYAAFFVRNVKHGR